MLHFLNGTRFSLCHFVREQPQHCMLLCIQNWKVWPENTTSTATRWNPAHMLEMKSWPINFGTSATNWLMELPFQKLNEKLHVISAYILLLVSYSDCCSSFVDIYILYFLTYPSLRTFIMVMWMRMINTWTIFFLEDKYAYINQSLLLFFCAKQSS